MVLGREFWVLISTRFSHEFLSEVWYWQVEVGCEILARRIPIVQKFPRGNRRYLLVLFLCKLVVLMVTLMPIASSHYANRYSVLEDLPSILPRHWRRVTTLELLFAQIQQTRLQFDHHNRSRVTSPAAMALVDYDSDSDSDSTPTPAPHPSKPTPLSLSLSALLPKPKPKAGPSIIASSSSGGARKIIVDLPKVGEGAIDDDGPPNKRARIGEGSGLGKGLASMLPAPKKRVQDGVGGEGRTGAGSGSGVTTEALGLGVARKERVLGGGAAKREDVGLIIMPGEREGWSGDSVTGLKPSLEEEDVAGPRLGEEGEEKEAKQQPPPKPVTQFMPQSVAKRTIQPMGSFRKQKALGSGGARSSGASTVEKPKPKVSLFGAVSEPMPVLSLVKPATEYKPLLVTSAPAPPEITPQLPPEAHYDPNTQSDPNLTYQAYPQPPPKPNSLESIAQTIGLDDAAMRQLLGRKGRGRNHVPDISQISTFDVNTEYASNTLLARSEEAQRVAGVNPVRSIAPGKHQLTQLLNAAQQQKGALEEAFAEGKRNRREAGGKYGW